MSERRDTYREDVAGRANVEDTPELLAYYNDLERFETAALWTVANKIEPWEPKSSSVPVLWKYEHLRSHVLKSVELVSPEKAGRRVIYLNNPGRRDVAAAVGLVVFRIASYEPRGGGLCPRALGVCVEIHYGRSRRLHHRRRS